MIRLLHYTNLDFNRQNHAYPSTVQLFEDVYVLKEESFPEFNGVEKTNNHYTLCNTKYDPHNRKNLFVSQEVIPFDLDGIDKHKYPSYMKLILSVLCTTECSSGDFKKALPFFYLIDSGHGLHLIMRLKSPITNKTYFADNRGFYNKICNYISKQFKKHNLPGKIDVGPFKPNATLRMPGSYNCKVEGEKLFVKVLKLATEGAELPDWQVIAEKIDDMEANDVSAWEASSDSAQGRSVEKEVSSFTMPETIYTKDVLKKCSFLKWCKESPEQVGYSEWFALGSLLVPLEDGENLFHEYSKGHPTYSVEETNLKVQEIQKWYDQGKPPRMCSWVADHHEGCATCPYKGKIISPIFIGPDTDIASKKDGFYILKKAKNGNISAKLDLHGLYTYFTRNYKHITLEEDARQNYYWTGTHWECLYDTRMSHFADVNLNNVYQTGKHVEEFVKKIRRNNLVRIDEFTDNMSGKLNLLNGILDLDTGELLKHDPDLYARFTLKYDYNPKAKCPKFDQFMQDCLCGDQKLINDFFEFVSTIFANVSPKKIQKMMIMTGRGNNGKGVLFGIIKELIGNSAVSAEPIKLLSDPKKKYNLIGKAVNMDSETDTVKFIIPDAIKAISAGDPVSCRGLYKQEITTVLPTKLIVSGNGLPNVEDNSDGYWRRLLLIPFNRQVAESEIDRNLESKLLKEAPGILNRIIEGYHRLKANDFKFIEDEATKKRVKEYRFEQNPIEQFVEECLIPAGSEARTLEMALIYSEYRQFCQTNGYREFAVNKFSSSLRRIMHFGKFDRRRVDGTRKYVVDGVKLTPFSDQGF